MNPGAEFESTMGRALGSLIERISKDLDANIRSLLGPAPYGKQHQCHPRVSKPEVSHAHHSGISLRMWTSVCSGYLGQRSARRPWTVTLTSLVVVGR